MEELTFEDFVEMERIDNQYFPKDNITPAKEAYKWYLKDKNTIVAIKEQGAVVAYINFLSLKKDVFEKIKNNEMNESRTRMTDLETSPENYMSYLYFASIAVEKNHRDFKTVAKLFLKCRTALRKLISTNVQINEVMADCSTKEGREVARKILHLKPYLKTSHGSQIFVSDGKSFVKHLR